jgi:hypothetical protein
MGLPIKTNTTCDIYRTGHAPPSAPDVAGVAINLESTFAPPHLSATTNSGTGSRWTHIALCDISVDIRDAYSGAASAVGEDAYAATFDSLYVPDKTGTKFLVVFVERVGYNSGQDFLRVFLQRLAPTWPTANL